LAIIFVEILTALTDERAQVKRYITAACIFVVIVFGVLVNLNAARFENKYVFWANAVSENPKSAIVRCALGMCFAELGKYEQAEAEFIKAVEFAPEHFKGVAYSNLGMIYLKQHNFAEAEKNLLTALKYNKLDDIAYYNLAQIYFLTGSKDKALKNAENALALEPQDVAYKKLYAKIKS
jgi:Tfp pilus assembly protein PilF